MINNEIFPDIDKNTEYQKLLARFKHSEETESDEFIIGEALKMYSELEWDEYDLKIRLLELLKDRHFQCNSILSFSIFISQSSSTQSLC